MKTPTLQVKDLAKHYAVKRTAFAPKQWLRAVDGLDFTVHKDTVFSLVGESGCGKSTVARLMLRLIEPTSGSVLFEGKDVFTLDRSEMKTFRRSVQIVFQDPFASLNPRRTVYETLSEPLRIHKLAASSELEDRVAQLLKMVNLSDVMNRYPHEFSGGQRQRVCIARALAVSPSVIVADEPLSALDVSVQAQILNLLLELKETAGITFLFISHDLRVVRYLSDEVGVMYLGKMVEHAPAEELFSSPLHPYTEILLSSAPNLVPGAPERPLLGGEVPSALDIPEGCPFHPRCPKAFDTCRITAPKLTSGSTSHPVACHLY